MITYNRKIVFLAKFFIITAFFFSSIFQVSPISPINALPSTNVFPTIDGAWNSSELNGEFPITQTIKTENNKQIEFGIRVNITHIFIGAKYDDDSPKTYDSSSPFPTHDYFAIGFDRNFDKSRMGTSASPDDTMFIGMEGNESEDLFMRGIRVGGGSVVRDEDNGGNDDTFGRFTLNGNTFTIEVVKKMNSGDKLGNDIQYEYGQRISIMLAYWDNLPILTEITTYSNFIDIDLLDPSDPDYYPTVSLDDVRVGALLIAIVVVFTGYHLISRKRID